MRIGVSSMRPRLTAALVVGVTLASAVPARADAITHWNNIIANAVAANRPNPGGFMDMAVIQAAVYDAVQAIERRYEPYYVAVPNASGSSSVAAAKCAHDLLTTFYSTNTALIESVDKAYADFLTDNGFSPADPGAAVGSAVAALYVPLYRLQGTPATSQGGTGVGQWRPTPPAGAAGFGPWVPFVTPFTLPSADYFRIKPQPELTSERYTIDYNEVKAKGSATNSTRTPEEQDTAVFYSDNFLVQWHRTLRGIAEQHVTDVADSSRLFALAGLAMRCVHHRLGLEVALQLLAANHRHSGRGERRKPADRRRDGVEFNDRDTALSRLHVGGEWCDERDDANSQVVLRNQQVRVLGLERAGQ